MSEYYSNEYLNGLPAQREVRLKAWARSRLAAAKYGDQAEAFMAESFLAGGEALGPFKAVGTAGKILKPAIQGAISGFAFFDPHEERLANMIQAWPAVANPITEFMAAKEGEGRLEGRLKRTLEEAGFGVAAEGAAKLLGSSLRAFKKIRAAKAAAEASPEAAEEVLRGMSEAAAETKPLSALGDIDGPVVAKGEARPMAVEAGRVAVKPEIEALEKAGFKVDHEAYNAPVAQDGKRLYGVSRHTLEAEGAFGDRWTNIITDPAKWPEKPARGKGLRGKIAHIWREKGREAYKKIRGSYEVDKTGERLVVGSEGSWHVLGQAQKPEAIQALPHLPEIINKAFKVGEYNPHPSSAAKPDMRRSVIYRSAVVIDGEPYNVQLVAKRTRDGRLELDFYDLRAQEKAGRSAGTRVSPGGPVDPSAAPTLSDLPEKGAPAGTREMSPGPTGYPPAPESGGLSETKVADFFGDVKDIVEDVSAVRPAEGGGRGRPGGYEGSEINEPASLRRASVSEEGEASRSITGSDESISQANNLVKADKKGGDFGGEAAGAGGFHQSELAAKKRRKFNESPVAVVKGDEIFPVGQPLPNLAGIRKTLIEWLKSRGWLKKFKNDDLRWDNISVSAGSITTPAWNI